MKRDVFAVLSFILIIQILTISLKIMVLENWIINNSPMANGKEFKIMKFREIFKGKCCICQKEFSTSKLSLPFKNNYICTKCANEYEKEIRCIDKSIKVNETGLKKKFEMDALLPEIGIVTSIAVCTQEDIGLFILLNSIALLINIF